MGIPSYFSYIVKNHRKIIFKLDTCLKNKSDLDNLYLDSNSIIYDCMNHIDYINDNDFEDKLITAVCEKIQYYINFLNINFRLVIK